MGEHLMRAIPMHSRKSIPRKGIKGDIIGVWASNKLNGGPKEDVQVSVQEVYEVIQKY